MMGRATPAGEGEAVFRALLDAARPEVRAALSVRESALAEVADALGRAAGSHPGIELSLVDFARHLGERLETAEALGQLHLADLFLAFACSRNARGAVAAFQAAVSGEVDRAAARVRPGAAFAADVRQVLWERLLSAEPPAQPRVLQYAGKGPLAGWVRMAAARTALNLVSSSPAAESLNEQLVNLSQLDPALALLRAEHGPRLKRALEQALSELGARERLSLRLSLIDGVALEQIARIYGVNRSSVSRWLSAARESIATRMRELVAAELGLVGDEAESLLRALRQSLDVSWSRLLA
jgi:RNA polymerase sigma-70 factor, ECF subfamily